MPDHDREHQDRLVADAECKAISGLSRATRWRRERDGKFPRRLQLGPRTVKTYPQYAAQVVIYQAYLGVTDHPAIFTATNSNTMARLHVLHEFDAETAQAWSDRAVMIIEATRAGDLLPRLTEDPSDWRCRMCSHNARCWE
jgi:predicted DNA-binding transcriptional regulator AlpA